MVAPALPADLMQLVPHRGPMLLMDRLEFFSDDVGEAVAKIADDHLFRCDGGRLHPSVLIEMVAQSAAAHEGYRRLRDDVAVGGGFLAGVRDFVVHETPRCGDTVRTVANRDMVLGALQTVIGRVERGGELLAEGRLVFYLSDDAAPPEMMMVAENGAAAIADHSNQRADLGLREALTASRLSLDRDAGRASYRFDADFPAFDGHFPELAILPAVVSVMCAERTVAAVTGHEMTLIEVRNGKFVRPILPGTTAQLRCEQHAADGGGERWKVHMVADDDVVAKMDLRLGRG